MKLGGSARTVRSGRVWITGVYCYCYSYYCYYYYYYY